MTHPPRLYDTLEVCIPCPETRTSAVPAEVRERLKAAGALMVDLDGVRVGTEDGWWLLRASGTRAVLVARCQSTTPEGLERLRRVLSEELAASGLTDLPFALIGRTD